MEPVLSQLAQVVCDASDLEALTRPMLELLEAVTGLESTYLTTIDEARGVQHILYARNTKSLTIPEGLSVPWNDTLCKRALEEGRPYTADVAGCWGDSEAARQLGIQTYLSQPVHTLDGTLYGTLCAASAASIDVPSQTLNVLKLFARIVAQQLDQERELEALKLSNAELLSHAASDPLTGLANRRALTEHLARLLKQASRQHTRVTLAFIDLDDFKAINDRYGHDAGDRFLIEIGTRLAGSLRAGDFVARYGGDEFVVVAPAGEPEPLRARLQAVTHGRFLEGDSSFSYAGPSIGTAVSDESDTDPDALLKRADAAMYATKQQRKGVGATRH